MHIDVWSDIACPWCAIGKARLQQALDRFQHRDRVTVAWHSFLLNPDAPAEFEGDYAARLARKYGRSLDEARAMQDNMAAEAAKEGLTFRFDRVRAGSTVDAHRLLHLAESKGLGTETMRRLMRAYLEEGVLMADHEALVRLGAEVGLSECDVRFMLAGDAYAEDVRTDLDEARRLGISGVPFFVIDGKYGISGAQPADTMLDILDEVWQRESPELVGAGAVCGPDGCDPL